MLSGNPEIRKSGHRRPGNHETHETHERGVGGLAAAPQNRGNHRRECCPEIRKSGKVDIGDLVTTKHTKHTKGESAGWRLRRRTEVTTEGNVVRKSGNPEKWTSEAW